MASPVTIRDLHEDERAWANAQYRAIQFSPTPPGSIALVAEAQDHGGARVGLGRLVSYAPDVLELGGIWTSDTVRGRGVARAMVSALLARVVRTDYTAPLWCIPFAHLAGFYQSFGFAPRAAPWPSAIADKVAECVAHAFDVVVLAR